ncbi:MAG: helix-turn-helix domain-containing protein [Acidimicrobiales bacterium]
MRSDADGEVNVVGTLVKQYRRERQWTQERLHDEIGMSTSWVAQVEQGEIEVRDINHLGRLALALGAPLIEFVRATGVPDAAKNLRERDYVEMVRVAIAGFPSPESLVPNAAAVSTTVTLEELEARTHHAWALVHASSYQELGHVLAALIPVAEAASRSTSDAAATRTLTCLADVYQVAAAMLVKVDDHGAAWVAADRAITAGERCGDRRLILAGQLRMARTMLDAKDQKLAVHVLKRAMVMAKDVKSSHDPGLISLVGACALLTGVLLARDHDTTSAQKSLKTAETLARQLGEDRNEYGTEFGPTNVAVHAVAISVELGNGQEALDRAKAVPARTLSPERQARFLIDVARANLLVKSPERAIDTLLHIEEIAPEELRNLGLVMMIIEEIEDQLGRRRSLALRKLKQRLYG